MVLCVLCLDVCTYIHLYLGELVLYLSWNISVYTLCSKSLHPTVPFVWVRVRVCVGSDHLQRMLRSSADGTADWLTGSLTDGVDSKENAPERRCSEIFNVLCHFVHQILNSTDLLFAVSTKLHQNVQFHFIWIAINWRKNRIVQSRERNGV